MSSRVEFSSNVADSRSSAARCDTPCTRGNRISHASRSGEIALTWIVSRGGCGGGDHGTGREVERDAEHVGVLDVEEVVLVQVVGLPAQRPADDLLAQELGAEGAHAQHVGDGAGIPALGQHRDGHTTQRGVSAEPGPPCRPCS